MAKKFFVDKSDEDYIPESVDEVTFETTEEINDAEIVVDAKAVSAENHRSLIAQLQGTPKQFNADEVAILKQLAKQGIAADFGDDGWARGYKWHMFK